jgi:hypothetical protein
LAPFSSCKRYIEIDPHLGVVRDHEGKCLAGLDDAHEGVLGAFDDLYDLALYAATALAGVCVHLHDVALQCLPHLARTDVDILVHTLHRDECRTCRIEIHLADELWRGHAPDAILPGTHFLEVTTHLQLMDHLLQLVAVATCL